MISIKTPVLSTIVGMFIVYYVIMSNDKIMMIIQNPTGFYTTGFYTG